MCVQSGIGRRRMMMFSMAGMVVGLALASIAFHCEPLSFHSPSSSSDLYAVLTKSTDGVLKSGSDYPESWSAVVIVAMVF